MPTSVSTHVLDTSTGGAAAGVAVELEREGRVIAATRTDADGRARLAEGLEAGLYRIRFRPPSPFFRTVELEVELGEGHYHIPLIASAYGCASYRGT